MILPQRYEQLQASIDRLAESLARFQTPDTGDPVDPARLATVATFVRANGTEEIKTYLKNLAGSYHRRASGSALRQLAEVVRCVTLTLRELAGKDGKVDDSELLYVLSWAQRLLKTREREASGQHGHGGAGPTRGPNSARPPQSGAVRR